MLKIIKESKTINPEELPKTLRRYAYMIEDFYKSEEFIGDKDYWCELAEPYETSNGETTLHDPISMIRYYLKEIERDFNEKNNTKD